jgi:hypothetical protein
MRDNHIAKILLQVLVVVCVKGRKEGWISSEAGFGAGGRARRMWEQVKASEIDER